TASNSSAGDHARQCMGCIMGTESSRVPDSKLARTKRAPFSADIASRKVVWEEHAADVKPVYWFTAFSISSVQPVSRQHPSNARTLSAEHVIANASSSVHSTECTGSL